MAIDILVENSVGEIVLNRPDKMNALNHAMMSELSQAFDSAEKAEVRALIIHGQGTSFCAGRDLADADPGNEDAEAILQGIFNPVIRRLADFPAPTFAAVHGACLGVGLGLALASDVVYVSEDAKIGSPFARIGAVLDSGGHKFFVQRIGPHRALELIYTSRLLSGTEAAAWGLVNQCVPKSDLLKKVRELAATVAKGPTAAFMESKRIIRMIDEESAGLSEVLNYEARAQGAAGRTADYMEGITAFQQKRPAKFIGR
jgi:enoyl-CoA hydratase/carnithine racemase